MQEFIKEFRFWNNNTNNIKSWNGRHYEKVKSLEDSGLLLKGVSKTIQNEVKKQNGGFLSMLLVTLHPSLFGNMLAIEVTTEIEQEMVLKVKDLELTKDLLSNTAPSLY